MTVFGGVTVDRIAATADTPVLGASNPGTVRLAAGGVGLNVASILARLGLKVRLVARIGSDADGEMVLAAAKAAGVDTSHIVVAPGERTAWYQGTFDENGGLIIGVADMAIYDRMTPETIGPAAAAAPASDFWVTDANLPAETLGFLTEQASTVHRPLAALTVSPAKGRRLRLLLSRVTHLFANRKEADVIIGTALDGRPHDTVGLAGELVAHGAANAVVTDGPNPLGFASRGETPHGLAPLRTNVRSVNGAGDSFAAGTIYGLSAGESFHDAVLAGLAAAAMTLEAGSVADAPFTGASLRGWIAGHSKKASA